MFFYPINKKNNSNDLFTFQNMIDDFFNESFFGSNNLNQTSMKVDVRETEKEYLIEADVPGIKKEEVNLEFNEGKLIISIHHEEQTKNEKDHYIHRERRLSSMRREIYLKDANREGIMAKLDQGVLQIIVPKLEKPDNRFKIEIK